MSKLIDNLKKMSGVTPQPMGFGRLREEAVKARILLIAFVKQEKLKKGTDALEKADGVLFHMAVADADAGTVKTKSQELPGVPCGWWLDTADKETIKQEPVITGDFVVFTAAAPVMTFQEESKLGKILMVTPGMDVALVRSINDLPVDAVLVAAGQGEAAPLTYESLLFYRLCASMLEKPLLAAVPLEVSIEELMVLWNAGVNGVLVAVEDKPSLDKLVELSAKINEATFPLRRKNKKMEPSLPAMVTATGEPQEEEEEEDDE